MPEEIASLEEPYTPHPVWISARRSFFLPIGVLSRVFRGKFVAGLRSALHRGMLQFHGNLLPLAEPRAFAAWLRVLFRHDWVVYSKRPFGGPEHVLRYLGAYTHRVGCGRLSLFRRDSLFRFGYGCMSRFGYGFNQSWQFRPGRLLSAVVAMMQDQ